MYKLSKFSHTTLIGLWAGKVSLVCLPHCLFTGLLLWQGGYGSV